MRSRLKLNLESRTGLTLMTMNERTSHPKPLPNWMAVPPDPEAGVSEVPNDPTRPMEWWRPGWSELRGHFGWRWILLLPLAISLAMIVLAILRPRWVVFAGAAFKFILFSGAVAISLTAYVFRRAAQVRQEPFCIHCGYNLTGLPDEHRCPDCGRPYNWRVIAEYRRDPQWFVERWYAVHKLPKPATPFAARRSAQRTRREV